MARPHELIVDLTTDEQTLLEQGCRSGDWPPRKVRRARALLLANIHRKLIPGEKSLDDAGIAKQAGCSKSMIGDLRKRFSLERVGALDEKRRSGRPRIIDGEVEAQMIAIACSTAPEGRERWTLRLIAGRLIELVDDLDDISFTTIGKALKKTKLSRG
jgi:transposase